MCFELNNYKLNRIICRRAKGNHLFQNHENAISIIHNDNLFHFRLENLKLKLFKCLTQNESH